MSAGSLYDAKTLPGKVTGLSQKRWWYFNLDFEAAWDKQTGVDGYEYVFKTSNGKKFASGTISYNTNSTSVYNINNSMIYTGRVRAFMIYNGQKYYGAWSDVAYFFTQPRITSIGVSNKKLTVKWGKVSGATGYDVYVSTKPTSGYRKVKSVSKKVSSVTITKFRSKKISSSKTYYVYIATKKKTSKKTYTSGKLYYWNSKTGGYGYF